MSLNPETQFVGKITAASPAYPYGSARNITVPGDGTGTPFIAALVNDLFGMQQALLKGAAIVPSGSPDQVGASQYLQAIVELASGRALTYTDTGSAGAYALTPGTDLEGPASYFNGLTARVAPANVNPGAATADIAGLGVKSIVDDVTGTALTGGEMVAGIEILLRYDGTNLRLVRKQAERVAAMFAWPLATPPTGSLECDGSAISRTTYAALFAEISTLYGVGDGSTTFNLPDLRGEFIRGFNNGSGNDPDAASRTDRGDGTTGDVVGSKQADEFESHTHGGAIRTSTEAAAGGGTPGQFYASSATATASTGGNETRGRNVQMLICINF